MTIVPTLIDCYATVLAIRDGTATREDYLAAACGIARHVDGSSEPRFRQLGAAAHNLAVHAFLEPTTSGTARYTTALCSLADLVLVEYAELAFQPGHPLHNHSAEIVRAINRS